MQYFLISDFREDYPSALIDDGILYNDHPKKESVFEILNIICKLGYDCSYFGGIKELIAAVNSKKQFNDCFFINLSDGMSQEYGRVQAPVLLEILDVPYSGSGVFGSALMNNKYYAKHALSKENIFMPKDTLVTKYIDLDMCFFKETDFPVIVKPNHEGSSVGITQKNVCLSIDEVKTQIEKLLPLYDELIIEEMIVGQDLTDLVIGNPHDIRVNEALITELKNKDPLAIYGGIEKVQKLRKLFLADDILDKLTVQKIHSYSENIFTLLHASDMARVDYRISKKNQKIYFLEINSAPRFSLNTELGFICDRKGWSVDSLIKEYIDTSIKRNFN